MRADPKSIKKIVKFSALIALSGSACAKASRETLTKLTPDVLTFTALSIHSIHLCDFLIFRSANEEFKRDKSDKDIEYEF
jgi:hypothetical protein